MTKLVIGSLVNKYKHQKEEQTQNAKNYARNVHELCFYDSNCSKCIELIIIITVLGLILALE